MAPATPLACSVKPSEAYQVAVEFPSGAVENTYPLGDPLPLLKAAFQLKFLATSHLLLLLRESPFPLFGCGFASPTCWHLRGQNS